MTMAIAAVLFTALGITISAFVFRALIRRIDLHVTIRVEVDDDGDGETLVLPPVKLAARTNKGVIWS